MVPNRYSDEYYAQALNQLNTSHDKSLQRLSNPEFNKINKNNADSPLRDKMIREYFRAANEYLSGPNKNVMMYDAILRSLRDRLIQTGQVSPDIPSHNLEDLYKGAFVPNTNLGFTANNSSSHDSKYSLPPLGVFDRRLTHNNGPSGYANDSGYSPSISMGDVVNGFTDYLMNGLKGITADNPYTIERTFSEGMHSDPTDYYGSTRGSDRQVRF